MEYDKYRDDPLLEREVFSYSPGPAQFPREVLLRAQRELVNWNSKPPKNLWSYLTCRLGS
jgi:hypothetical protein